MGALIQGLVLSDRRLIDFPLPTFPHPQSNRYPDPDYEVLMGFDDESGGEERRRGSSPGGPPTPISISRKVSTSTRMRWHRPCEATFYSRCPKSVQTSSKVCASRSKQPRKAKGARIFLDVCRRRPNLGIWPSRNLGTSRAGWYVDV